MSSSQPRTCIREAMRNNNLRASSWVGLVMVVLTRHSSGAGIGQDGSTANFETKFAFLLPPPRGLRLYVSVLPPARLEWGIAQGGGVSFWLHVLDGFRGRSAASPQGIYPSPAESHYLDVYEIEVDSWSKCHYICALAWTHIHHPGWFYIRSGLFHQDYFHAL